MRAIIVDDELNARLALRGIIEENFPEIEIVAENADVPNAVKSIHSFQPELVFLDIAMPGYSGLELLKFFDENSINFKIIFVTAYTEYAINAFELSAVDYILKPVRIDALQRALSKVNEAKSSESLKVLQSNFDVPQNKKIALNTGDGITFIELQDILYLKADGSYTHFFISNKNKITVSKKIAEFERLEQVSNFMRIHRSHIINLERIQKILKQDGGTVIMDNGDELSISADRKAALLEKFESFRF
ncbi:LytTR family DNA-binding domain-containing protein [Flavobacterium sp.]|uniref:LytR/AlgR family response regulator transcription factor n=1 Tax=Flavobacterium sp. TaxID=239 RepID=UPI0026254AD7|nr:LytTR family DNA-binding domain-containing protein [Flavobacterium sp.]